MSKKLQELIDSMMKELGFDFPEEVIQEYRRKKIVVVNDDTGEVEEVLKEVSDDADKVNTE